MDYEKIIADVWQYMQANPAGSIAAGVITLYLLVKRPKLLLTLVVLGIAGYGVMLIFDKLSSTGISSKEFRSLKGLK